MGDGVEGRYDVKIVVEDAMSSSISIIRSPYYEIMRSRRGKIRYAAACRVKV